jgi:hypothetical protein
MSPWLKARPMAQPLLEETRTAMGKARNSLDPKKPQFSQVELCEVAEIPMATANNWILTGALRPADVGSHGARKPRLFSVVTIFEAKVTGDLVKWLGTPPPIAAGMARKTTDGHNWYWSIPRDLARNNPRDFFAMNFRNSEDGIGKEMRSAVLHFAFEGLGAEFADANLLPIVRKRYRDRTLSAGDPGYRNGDSRRHQ